MTIKDRLMWLKILKKDLALNKPIHVSNAEQILIALGETIEAVENYNFVVDLLKQKAKNLRSQAVTLNHYWTGAYEAYEQIIKDLNDAAELKLWKEERNELTD